MVYKLINSILLLFWALIGNTQTLKYEAAQKSWSAGLGNHRAVLNVNKPADAVRLQSTGVCMTSIRIKNAF